MEQKEVMYPSVVEVIIPRSNVSSSLVELQSASSLDGRFIHNDNISHLDVPFKTLNVTKVHQ